MTGCADRVALVTGITGQDGAYLSKLQLNQGYEVHGVKRRSLSLNTGRIKDVFEDPHVEHQRFHLHYCDLTDSTNLTRIVEQTQPDKIYNLTAQRHVHVSFEWPEHTANADAIGTLRLLKIDPRYFHPTEAALLIGDTAKADLAVVRDPPIKERPKQCKLWSRYTTK